MAGSINKVIIVGNVGSQPEIRSSQVTGEEIATLSLATGEKWKDKRTGEIKEKTDWHKIVIFSPGLVKVVKNYVYKGSKLYVEGKIQNREYDSGDGRKKYISEIVLSQYNSTLVLLDSKKDGSYSQSPENSDFSSSTEERIERYEEQKKKVERNTETVKDEIPF